MSIFHEVWASMNDKPSVEFYRNGNVPYKIYFIAPKTDDGILPKLTKVYKNQFYPTQEEAEEVYRSLPDAQRSLQLIYHGMASILGGVEASDKTKETPNEL